MAQCGANTCFERLRDRRDRHSRDERQTQRHTQQYDEWVEFETSDEYNQSDDCADCRDEEEQGAMAGVHEEAASFAGRSQRQLDSATRRIRYLRRLVSNAVCRGRKRPARCPVAA